MARYIDADALIKKIFPIGMVGDGMYVINAKAVKFAIDNTPTADVVSKSEVENYKKVAEYQQKLAMDRYFEIKRLQEDVERWRRNLEAVLEERAEEKSEVAREIFEELDKFIVTRVCVVYGQVYDISDKYMELKKKYTEET